MYFVSILQFNYEFDKTNEVMRIVKEFGLKIIKQDYIENCLMEVEIRQSMAEKIIEKIADLRCVEIVMRDGSFV